MGKKIGLDFITVQIYAKQVLIVQLEVVVIIKQKMKSVHVLVSVQVICRVVTVSVDINKGIGRILIIVLMNVKQELCVRPVAAVRVKQKMKSVHVPVSVQVICRVVMVNVNIKREIGRILIIVLMNVKQGLCVHLVVVVIVNQNMHRVHALNNAQDECLVVMVNVDTNKGIGRI